MDRYDVVAIGGGTAGLVTAAGAASLGLRAALVEREALGGDCLWTGCVPSKALIASARLARQMRDADRLGLAGASPGHAFRAIMDRMRAARATVAHHDDPERFRSMGVEVVFGDARLVRQDTVEVGDRALRTKHVVIATGARAVAPPVPGLEEAGYLTHHTVFDLDELPRRLAILGAGPVGVEFAQIFARLGARVTVFEMEPRVLPREDAEASAVVATALGADGVTLALGMPVERVERVERAGTGFRVTASADDGREHIADVDAVLVATGRRPATAALGLDETGVATDGGAVLVDDTLRSAVPTVWAAGDVVGGPQFTHVAEYHAKLVLRNVLSPLRAKVSYEAVPRVTYSDPEVAQVGWTEVEARERFGDDVGVWRYPFDDLDRAIVDGRTDGFVKLVTGRKLRLVGASIVGGGAGELLPAIVLAMQEGLPVTRLSHLVWAYPTMAEGVKRAADTYYRQAFDGVKGKLLRTVARWLA